MTLTFMMSCFSELLDLLCQYFQYGLYSAFMGCFVYIFLGSSKDITVGPTAIMSLLTAEYASKGPAVVVLLTFLSGWIIMLLGFLKLGIVCLHIDVISSALIIFPFKDLSLILYRYQ